MAHGGSQTVFLEASVETYEKSLLIKEQNSDCGNTTLKDFIQTRIQIEVQDEHGVID